ncbi:MAG: zinc-dependent metalloprotease [Rhizobacter sp.]
MPKLAAPICVLLLAGCASLAPPESMPSAAAPAAAAAAPAAAAPPGAAQPGVIARLPAPGAQASAAGAAPPGGPAPGAPRPFAEVIKDAKQSSGLFTLWQKDDKVWLELAPADFNQPFFLSPKYKTGLGEGRFFGGLMGEEVVIEFRRVHNQVQMLARNTEFVATPKTPNGRAVEAAFSPSLLASTSVVSQPHPERKSVLVEANPLFINDMMGVAMGLQRQYRQGYGLDTRNSAITDIRTTPDLVVLEVLSHYATGSIAVATPGVPVPPGTPLPSVPRSVPDPRSLFMTLHYSLARLPEHVMAPRRADGRVGHFTSNLSDFSDDLARTPRQRFVNRWRLEKKDPAAALSEPVKPITFWLDNTIPEKYRASVTAGILEWNKAFEQVGFKDAIRVEVQPDDATWDTLDFGRASVRWMTNSSPSFGAIGPSHVDPRSGEILDADIGIESLSSRSLRSLRSQVLTSSAATELPPELAARGMRSHMACDYADQAAEQLGYALDVLEARGDIEPGSPEAEQFVQGYMKDVTMHEVGHTLGLRHNFRSSRVYSDAQLSDPAFTATHSIAGSVMEYAAINLSAPGIPSSRQGTPFNSTIGPYDYWAIEYAYRPLPAAQEEAALAKIAARSAEPELAFGTDEDNLLGIDPETLQFDLGSDVLAFARKRIAIAHDLLERQETRVLSPDQDYSILRRSVTYALRDMGRAASVLTRQIGGVRTVRDHAGSGRDPLAPLPAADQRAALDLLARGFLSADSLRISPALQRKLAVDYLERGDAALRGDGTPATALVTDFSLASQVIELQRAVLGQLLSDSVAARLLDSEDKLPKDALRLSDLYRRLDDAVWGELGHPGDIPSLRRELQRDHINRIATQLLRPAALSRVDARSLVRAQAQTLLARLNTAAKRPGLSAEAQAHLQDSIDTLQQALTARLARTGA